MSELWQVHHLIPVIPFEKTVMSRGDGSYLLDSDGKKYLDLNSGQFCAVLGHSHPDVLRSVWGSLSKLTHTSTKILSEEVVDCSNQIYRISGDMRASCIFLSTGAEAVEFCLRYAKFLRNKNGIICFDKGYHGLTLGAQSVTYSGIYARPQVSDIHTIPVPQTKNDIALSIESLEAIIRKHEIAAILLEPILSVGGMLFPPAEWFKEVRVLCDRYEVYLLLDECQTGFGRTGNWFAYQTYGFIPDMVATAKGIGLGFPVSVAMFRNSLLPNETVYGMTHYSSHQNDSFAACIVNAGIKYIETHNLFPEIQKKALYFLSKLRELEDKNAHVANARGCGLMLGIDLSFNTDDYRDIYNRLYRKTMRHGVIIQGTNGGRTIRFLPDYLMKAKDIDFAIDTLHNVLLNEMSL